MVSSIVEEENGIHIRKRNNTIVDFWETILLCFRDFDWDLSVEIKERDREGENMYEWRMM